jgi:hypothetical protein
MTARLSALRASRTLPPQVSLFFKDSWNTFSVKGKPQYPVVTGSLNHPDLI